MSPASHLRELDLLRSQIADLARELAERDRRLHERTRHLHVAQSLAHLGSWDWDVDSGEVQWSDELYRIFGREPESQGITFDTFTSAILPDDHDRVLASIKDAFGGRARYDVECRIVRPSGEVRTIHCCGEVLRDDTGKPCRMSGSVLDITERKRMELALQQEDAYFRALIEHSSDGLMVLDLDGTIRFESPSIERLLGYAQHELDGRIAFDLVHPEDLATVTEKLQSLIHRPGTAQIGEFRFRHKDGSWRNCEGIGRVIRDPDGRCRVIVNSRDISERKRTEAMLQTSQERLRQALHASGTGLWDWNTETNEVAFSEEWKRQLGYEPAEIADSFETWTTLLHPEDRDTAVAYARDYVTNREGDYRQEFRLKHKDGGYRWIEARASFVAEADGRRIRLLGSHTDITDRKRMEESVRQSEEWYRTLIELLPSGAYVFSEGRTVYVNHTGAVLMGAKDAQEILDRPMFEFIHPDHHQEVHENVERLLTGGASVHSAERIFLMVDGTPIPVHVEAARITWNGKPAILSLFSDITERKRMEEERQRTLTLLTNVINATPDLIFVKDPDLRTVLCNNAYAQAVGKTSEEMIGHTDIENGWDPELVRGSPDKGIRGFEADDRQALNGQFVRNPADPANVNGEIRIFDTYKVPLRSETGEVMGVLGVARDITARLSMEAELKKSEARLHEAQRIAHLGSWQLDLTANRLSWSPETHRIFEINEDQFDASYETVLSAVHPDDRSALRRAYTDSVRDRTPCEIVHRLLLPDGRVKYVQERCETTYDAQGAPQRSFGTVQDVTEFTRLAQREAARVNQLKKLSELSLTLSGDPAVIFKEVVRIIGELFKVRVICLSEIVGQELHFKAVYINGQVVLDAGRCPLDVTPCATVEMDRDLRLYDRVMDRFPRASFLQDHNAVSYCGFPSLDAHGQVVAVTCLLDDKPHEYTEEDQELLRVFGQRIALEVERARHLAERKAAEETLYRTTSMLTALIQSSPVAIITADTEGHLTSWNPAAERIFGWTEQEVLGGQVPYLSPEDQEEAKAVWDLAIGGGNTQGLELRRFRKDRSRIDVEFWGGALRDQVGTVTGAFGVISDITERKESEQALWKSRQAIRALHDISSAQGQSFNERVEALLQLGCRYFDLPIGMETFVRGDELEVGQVNAPGMAFRPGMRVSLSKAYSSEVLRQRGSVCFTHAGASPEWQWHPAYAALKLESYIGTPINGPDGPYGILCFASVEPRRKPFTESERDFIQLMAQWLGGEMDRQSALVALRQSEERYRTLYDETPSMYFTVDGTGVIRSVNQYGAQYLGYRVEDLVGESVGEIFFEADRARVCSEMEAFFRHPEGVAQWEFRKVRSDGAVLWVREHARVLQRRDGESLALIVCEDITERKQSEEALRENHERLTLALEASHTGTWRVDLKTGLDTRDASLNRLLALPATVTTQPVEEWFSYVHPDDAPLSRHAWERGLTTGLYDVVHRLIPRDGDIRWVHDRGMISCDATGQPLYAIGAVHDITERKRAEELLQAAKDRLQAILDNSTAVIFIKNIHGQYLLINRRYEELHHVTQAEIVGKTDYNIHSCDVAEVLRANDRQGPEAKKPFQLEETVPHDDGLHTFVSIKFPLNDGSGKPYAVCGIATDITERKQMEEALRQREGDLRAALEERERISQDLHDGILQSLYAVGLGLEACKPLVLQEQKRDAMKLMTGINQAIGQLNQVMGEVRNFIAGLESLVVQGGDFPTALRNLVRAMSSSSSAKCTVRIDNAAARQLTTEQALHIINIVREGLSNALRHSGAKRITLSLRSLIRSVRLAITDDGVGFNADSAQGVGHGLGNMAARAQKVRGVFAIQSKPHEGTTISLDLPKDTTYAHN